MPKQTPHRRFLDPSVLAKIQGLGLRAKQVVDGYISGMHRSPSHGFSAEFAEHREYVPGDDLRYVDWKVYGKTNKVYLKQYEEETNLICYLLLDRSESMQYQSKAVSMSKLEYAQCAIASLAYMVLRHQDSVGLTSFGETIATHLRPSANPSHLQSILAALEEQTAEGTTQSGRMFHDLAERMNRRGIVIIASDFLDDLDTMLAGLQHFRHRRHEVILLHIVDPAEQTFPFEQVTLFKGLEQLPNVLTDPKALRKAYLEEYNRFQRRLQAGARAQGADYVLVPTDQPLDIVLSTYLRQRKA